MSATSPEQTLDRHEGRAHWAATAMAWVVAGLVLALYLATAAPNPWWGDGMELATSAKVLGVAHPTGYPLFMIVGHSAIRLMSWMEPGRATTVLDSILMAAACGLLILVLMRRMLPRTATGFLIAAGVSMLVAVAHTVWDHATITEVYPLTYFMCLAVLSVAWSDPDASPGKWRVAALCGLLGLAQLNHYSILAYYPLVFLMVLEWCRHRSWRERIAYLATGFFSWAIMLAGYLYLPLRARANPPMNWGNTVDWNSIIGHMAGGQYRMLNSELWGGGFGYGLRRWLAWWTDQYFPGNPPLLSIAIGTAIIAPAVTGLVILARRRTMLGLGFLFAVVATLCFSIFYHIPDIHAYFLPALPMIAIGWIEAGRFLVEHRGRPYPRWLAVAPAICAMLVAYCQYPYLDKSKDTMPVAYAAMVFKNLPQNAVLIADGDNETFSIWYYQIGLGQRPDVTVIADNFLLMGWYANMLKAQGHANVPVRVVDRPPTVKLDWDIDMACGVIIPCFEKGYRIFATTRDDIQQEYFQPKPVATLPPGDLYRRLIKTDAHLPQPTLWELQPNPNLAKLTRDEIYNEFKNFYYFNLMKPGKN